MRELDKVLNQQEKVLWEGKPDFKPSVLGGSICSFIFGLIWFIFLAPFILSASVFQLISGVSLSSSVLIGGGLFMIPFILIGFVLMFGLPLYGVLVYKNIYYAITDRRVIIQKGLVGRDFDIVEFDQITDAKVRVGFFDKIFGGNTGSIVISTSGSFFTKNGEALPIPYLLGSIHDPYKVFQFFQQLSHDVKTDIYYPNKLRPEENPGYTTNYKGDATLGVSDEI